MNDSIRLSDGQCPQDVASTMHSNNANPQSFIENNLLPNGMAQTFQTEASARRPCRAECGLSKLENNGFAHCSSRCSIPSRGSLVTQRSAWPGHVAFRCRKVACATNWPPTLKLAKHTKRLAKHGGNLPNQKCCFPNSKRVIFIIGAPALVIAKSSRLLAGKVTCLHSGTGCIKAKFSEMLVFQFGK